VLTLDLRFGLDGALEFANRRLFDALSARRTARVLNAGGWVRRLGERGFSAKGWYLTKDPFSYDLWKLAAADVKAAVLAFAGRAKKLIVLDLDNTLWGGEVGDAGVAGLRLGGHDATGEAFVALQRELLALQRRGVLLGVASKNDEAVALEAIDTHPEMVLRRDDFAGWVITWDDKGSTVRRLCEQLRIAPADAVFIDDNPAERAAVAAALPEMLVVDWPVNPMRSVDVLRGLNVFDVPEVTDEDLARGRTYAGARTALAAPGPVETTVDVRPFDEKDIPRVVQLMNKTNQVNLTTRRVTEEALRAWLAEGERAMWSVRVRDAFADYGLVGVLAVEISAGAATVTDFLMSCRVIARGVEDAMLRTALEHARARGCPRLALPFVPTDRNEPMRRFLASRGDLVAREGGGFVASLAAEAAHA
jgi:FkbH-like protein